MPRIARADSFDIFRTALLGNLQAGAQRGLEHSEAIGHHFRQHPRALTATSDKHAQQAFLGERRIGLIAQREHIGAHRIADQICLFEELGVEPIHFAIGNGNGVYLLGKEAIDPAQHGILFVDNAGNAR